MTRTRSDGRSRAGEPVKQLRLPALRIRQGRGRDLYSFAIDGKLVPQIATVSRIRRDEKTRLHGYQRPEVLNHVAAIRRYIETDDSPLLPNAIVIAFDDRVRFEAGAADPGSPEYVQSGTLVIPVTDGPEHDRPGFIVDGQQRCAAIRDARIEQFPVTISAFITNETADQRSQFILVNSTKALPKGLIHELLPGASGALPVPLRVRQLPATLLERLNFETGSPLHRMIQTPTNPTGHIKDNSVLRMLENSLSDGALYRFRNDEALPYTGQMFTLLCSFWAGVRDVFPDAWNKPPRKSRLMHGAGIISMGYLMDAIAHARQDDEGMVDKDEFAADLKAIADDCCWTEGVWTFSDGVTRRWNDIQNTPRDIQRVTDFLLSRYRAVGR
ncbi:DGQHR domain-containing protein DpdB [Micromonospora aurantiaca (nom. illeg.)]|uniref:DGQHR domain-containing protein DpdB n=1 Tax=Micromonospora aurantiaca (nom. illeg.) TaxID=47850 RepID=UPI0037992975